MKETARTGTEQPVLQPEEDLQDRVQTEGTMYDPPADLLREAAVAAQGAAKGGEKSTWPGEKGPRQGGADQPGRRREGWGRGEADSGPGADRRPRTGKEQKTDGKYECAGYGGDQGPGGGH